MGHLMSLCFTFVLVFLTLKMGNLEQIISQMASRCKKLWLWVGCACFFLLLLFWCFVFYFIFIEFAFRIDQSGASRKILICCKKKRAKVKVYLYNIEQNTYHFSFSGVSAFNFVGTQWSSQKYFIFNVFCLTGMPQELFWNFIFPVTFRYKSQQDPAGSLSF